MTRVCDHDEACACYVEGYAQGKDKAHFEVRAILDSHGASSHADDCGCEPCKTVRMIATALAMRWSS